MAANNTPKGPNHFLTVTECVSRLKLSPIWIRRLLQTHKLEGRKVDGDWMVEVSSVESYLAEKRQRETLRLKQLQNYHYPYIRPTKQSIRMVMSGLDELSLDSSTKQTVITVLTQLDQLWTKRYEEKKKNKEAPHQN